VFGVFLPNRLLPLLHEHQHPVHPAPSFGRPALSVSAARRAASEPGLVTTRA
jgi:hypothetical protein